MQYSLLAFSYSYETKLYLSHSIDFNKYKPLMQVGLNGLIIFSILGTAAAGKAQDLRGRIDSYQVQQIRTSGILTVIL